MSQATGKDHPRVALPGLLDVVKEAMLTEFRADLLDAGYADIRPTHGCVFRFVRAEGIRLTELASLAGITKQSAGELVDDLVGLGYVERIPDPADRRAKLICLTERGREVQRIGFGLFAAIEERWAARYGPERFAELRELLEEVAAAEAPHMVPEVAKRVAAAPA
jgi:DNA-binding MarR family transcriptional regulator